MDSKIFGLLSFISFFLFMLAALKIGKNLKKKDSTPNLPPGPWKLPIIGHIHHLVTSTPHRILRDLAKIYGPLMHLQLGEISSIVVSSPEYAREVLKTHDVIFASRPKIVAVDILLYGSTDIAFSPYGNYWRQLQKICTIELLTQKRVNSFQPIREEELTKLIKRIDSQQGSPINITQAVLTSIMTIKAIILDMIGAGGETSSTTVVWAMSELARDPRVMKKAQFEVREIFNKKGIVGENLFEVSSEGDSKVTPSNSSFT